MNVYVYVRMCMCIYPSVRVCMKVCVYIRMCARAYGCMRGSTHLYVHVYVYLRMYVYAYLRMCVVTGFLLLGTHMLCILLVIVRLGSNTFLIFVGNSV